MAKILYAWELGGGFGHVSVAAPVLAALQQRGHTVVAVVCDVSSAHRQLAALGIRYHQAPRQSRPPDRPMQPPCTFAHVLNNRVFGRKESAIAVAHSWRWLIEDLQPNLVLFDHCPSGLLATHGSRVRRVVFGTGFTCPPALSPFPSWRQHPNATTQQLRRDEDEVLGIINSVLATSDRAPLGRLCDLYTQVDAEILTTYPELDHFGMRPDGDYYGAWPADFGEEPHWPVKPGKRVFAYLKSSPELKPILAAISDSKLPTLVFCPDIQANLRDEFSSSALRIATAPQKMSAVVAACDFAITNGTHTTVAQVLRAAKPVISVPLFLEQQITGERVAAFAAGLCVPGATRDSMAAALSAMAAPSSDFPGAQRFADKYHDEDAARAVERIASRLHELASAC